jgi:DNA-binding GntR family transcriptional regulator
MVGAVDLYQINNKGRSASDLAYETLCKLIVEGELKPGQRLREAELAEAFGVSRTPIREAVRRVEEQHLLNKQLNGAYFVAEWDKRTVLELATLRGALEGLAISLAFKYLTEDDYLYLEDIVETMDKMVKRKDYEKLNLLDIQFHSFFWTRSRHQLLQETLSEMAPQIRYYMIITKRGDEESYPETHQEIIDVLKQGDVTKAVETVKKHILEAAANVE